MSASEPVLPLSLVNRDQFLSLFYDPVDFQLQTKTALYIYLTTRGLMDPPVRGLTVIDCMGKYNIHRFVAILSAFGIDHSVVYDGDGGGSQDAKVGDAIANARSTFTKRITRFVQDLETELGISSLPRNESHRKPQYVLYHLETRQVDASKLDGIKQEFVDLATATGEAL